MTSSGLVVDTSSVVAILSGEAGQRALLEALTAATDAVMSAPTFLELGIVLEVKAPGKPDIARRFVREARIEVLAFDQALADRALHAWRRYGKGRHPAGLNLGDCFTYALAEHTGYPILCVGNDFRQTDLPVVQA